MNWLKNLLQKFAPEKFEARMILALIAYVFLVDIPLLASQHVAVRIAFGVFLFLVVDVLFSLFFRSKSVAPSSAPDMIPATGDIWVGFTLRSMTADRYRATGKRLNLNTKTELEKKVHLMAEDLSIRVHDEGYEICLRKDGEVFSYPVIRTPKKKIFQRVGKPPTPIRTEDSIFFTEFGKK